MHALFKGTACTACTARLNVKSRRSINQSRRAFKIIAYLYYNRKHSAQVSQIKSIIFLLPSVSRLDHPESSLVGSKRESTLTNQYTYGIIKSLEFGDDIPPRKAVIQYKNENEDIRRETNRSVRGLVIIHPIDECDFMVELDEMAKNVDKKFVN
eukprot:TCONS_00036066-protein